MSNTAELKKAFQEAVVVRESPDPKAIIAAWHAYDDWQTARNQETGFMRGHRTPHVLAILNALEERRYVDPTTASIGIFGFELVTSETLKSRQNEVPPLLEGLEPEDYQIASTFCRAMVNAAHDPRHLDEMFSNSQ
ncbi:MAG: hypothetical protein UX62_C0031G0007 [Microgenomates group bacterium GW2011_GWA2_46_7]|nr:MAG: hypothetical protein UX62_C0031G0007 [Microgenomates group bacterium GW2011_GWA2_46_7]